ncbi:hypothetical protein KM043_004753 [Ampulex compressa]|nr:hypothetical protein KM043_004753 [Ampulex compressa]
MLLGHADGIRGNSDAKMTIKEDKQTEWRGEGGALRSRSTPSTSLSLHFTVPLFAGNSENLYSTKSQDEGGKYAANFTKEGTLIRHLLEACRPWKSSIAMRGEGGLKRVRGSERTKMGLDVSQWPGKRKDRRRKRRGEANRKVVLEGEERGEQAENGEHGVNASDGNGNPAFSAFRGEERGPCQLAIGRHVVRSSERRWCFECSANERTPTWHFSTAIYVEGQRATGSPQLNPTHSHAVSLPLCFFFSPCSLSLPLRLSVGTGEDTRFGIRSGCARFHEKSVARLS